MSSESQSVKIERSESISGKNVSALSASQKFTPEDNEKLAKTYANNIGKSVRPGRGSDETKSGVRPNNSIPTIIYTEEKGGNIPERMLTQISDSMLMDQDGNHYIKINANIVQNVKTGEAIPYFGRS